MRVTLDGDDIADSQSLDQWLAIHEAISVIGKMDEKLAKLVELRFFAGLTEVEMAEYFGVTERTVRRNWKKAKAVLNKILQSSA